MLSANRVRGFVPVAIEQYRRADQVGEQDRHEWPLHAEHIIAPPSRLGVIPVGEAPGLGSPGGMRTGRARRSTLGMTHALYERKVDKR